MLVVIKKILDTTQQLFSQRIALNKKKRAQLVGYSSFRNLSVLTLVKCSALLVCFSASLWLNPSFLLAGTDRGKRYFEAPSLKVSSIISVQSSVNTGISGVRIFYRLPCGAVYLGVVAEKSSGVLKLGVAYQSTPISCMNLSQVESRQIPWLDSDQRVRPLTQAELPTSMGRWRSIEPSMVLTEPMARRGRSSHRETDVVYVSSCSRRTLLLFRGGSMRGYSMENPRTRPVTLSRKQPQAQSLSGRINPTLDMRSRLGDRLHTKSVENSRQLANRNLGLSILEFKPANRRARSSCRSREKHIKIRRVVDFSRGFMLMKSRGTTKEFERLFSVRLASVRKGSFRRLQSGGVAVEYQRLCNEAPVGLIVSDGGTSEKSRNRDLRSKASPPSQVTSEKSRLRFRVDRSDEMKAGRLNYSRGRASTRTRQLRVNIAVLVATYYNRKCDVAFPKNKTLSRYSVRSLSIPKRVSVGRLRVRRSKQMLRVRTPAVTGSKTFPTLRYLSVCSRSIGAVYSSDYAGRLSVGVVEKRLRISCNNPPKKVSLKQAFLRAPDNTGRGIYPLRIKGLSEI